MSVNDKVDVIIFGATGFTGKVVVQEFIKLNENNKFTWAVAGRNQSKLQEVLTWASAKTGQNVSQTPTVVADCGDEVSLKTMTSKGRVIINCCGPYRFYGEPVIKACIENGSHHIDVSGEPEYMERVQLEYNKAAEEKKVYIVSACGFDSVPADFGVLHFIENFPGLVNSIESYLACSNRSSEPAVNVGTWESLVYAAANMSNLKPIRTKLFAPLNRLKLEPRLKSKLVIHKSPVFDNKYSLPFPGSDKTVVLRTQQFMYTHYQERPVQYRPYLITSIPVAIVLMIMGFFLLLLGKISYGRRLLLKYPEIFSFGVMSRKGPSEEARANTFARFRFKGEGWSRDVAEKFEDKTQITAPVNKSMVTEMSMADFGYGFTAKSVVLSAFTILEESDRMPLRGGVYTPGAAFSRTSFLSNLPNIGVTLKVLSSD